MKADPHVACAGVQVLAQSKPSAVAKGGAAKNYDCCYLSGKEGGHQALVTRGKHSVDSGFYCHMPQQVSVRVCGFIHCGHGVAEQMEVEGQGDCERRLSGWESESESERVRE